MPPDWKPPKRVKDKKLLKELHRTLNSCAVCGGTYGITLHHVVRRSQGGGDTRENIIPLCQGPSTNDCHGRLHAGDLDVRERVAVAHADRLYLSETGRGDLL